MRGGGLHGGMRVRFTREFMKMFAAGGEEKEETKIPGDALASSPRILLPTLLHCTGDAPPGTTPLRACARVCVYVAARYYRIILGYFTGT